MNRLLTAAATAALVAGLTVPQIAAAQAKPAAQPKTEAAAAAVTGKASTDGPAATAVQGAAQAVRDGAAPVAGATPAAAATPKPVVVAGDLMETLRLSGQFATFVQGVDATNLTGLLKSNKNLTVFVPTDAAFAAMPAADLARLKADKAAMQKFLLHHVVNAPIPSSKIKGARGPVPTGAGDQILLDGSDESGALKVDNATIVQADLQTTSGLLQVLDQVLTPGAAGASGAAAPASATAATQPSAKP